MLVNITFGFASCLETRMTTNFASSTRFDLSLIAASPMSANGTLKTLPKPPLLFRVWDGLISRFTKVAANVWFQTFTTLITIYALFGDDLKTAEFDKTTDGAFDILVFSATAIFAIEICINSLGRAGYFNSFYFWLDIVSTATLALDVSFISESVFGSADTVADEARGLGAHSGQGNGGSMLSKAGSKASRIVRIIRLIRLIRVVKIYKVWMQRKKDELESYRKDQEAAKEMAKKRAAAAKAQQDAAKSDATGASAPAAEGKTSKPKKSKS